MVTGPSICDMLEGGRYTETFSVLGSTLASSPLETCTLSQMSPLASRIRPCESAASPLGAVTLNGFTSPVLASMRATEVVRLGDTEANHRLLSLSAAASCGSEPTRDVVPMVQSLPLLGGTFEANAWSWLSGTSYSLNTTRAASPVGRARVVILKLPAFGPRTL